MGHLHTGILLGCKKERNLTVHDSVDGLTGYYSTFSEISQRKTRTI